MTDAMVYESAAEPASHARCRRLWQAIQPTQRIFVAQNKKGHLMKDDPLKPKTGNKNGVP